MNTRSVNSAAGVILAALEQNRTAAGIAMALDSAGLLMSPEKVTEYDQALEDLTGANLARWEEEEQESARLRLALKSAQRGRRDLRARVAELLAERHSTNEALDDAVQELRAREGERAGHFTEAARLLEATGRDDDAVNLLDNVASGIRVHASLEDPHDGPLAHSYRVGRDLPETGGA